MARLTKELEGNNTVAPPPGRPTTSSAVGSKQADEPTPTDANDGDISLDSAKGYDAENDDHLDQQVRASSKFWTSTPDESAFWGTSNILPTLPTGLYRCAYRDDIGHFLKKMMIATDELIEFPDTSCDEVIEEIQLFWDKEEEYRKRGFLHKRGILMYGEPGSGKTCVIQRLIRILNSKNGIAIYSDDPHSLTSCLQMVRRIEKDRPIIVVLEDFETLTDRQHRENEWLSVLDGEAQIDNVVFLATTNYIDKLDKRFTDRPSRFDHVQDVPMPKALTRALYFYIKEPNLTNEEIERWVELSKGFSFAHMKELIAATKCLGKDVELVAKRMKDMQQRKFKTEDDLRDNPKGGLGFGVPTTTDDDGTIDWDMLKKYIKLNEKHVRKE